MFDQQKITLTIRYWWPCWTREERYRLTRSRTVQVEPHKGFFDQSYYPVIKQHDVRTLKITGTVINNEQRAIEIVERIGAFLHRPPHARTGAFRNLEVLSRTKPMSKLNDIIPVLFLLYRGGSLVLLSLRPTLLEMAENPVAQATVERPEFDRPTLEVIIGQPKTAIPRP